MSWAHKCDEIRRYNLAKSHTFSITRTARTGDYNGSQHACPGLRPAPAWPGTTARTGPTRLNPLLTLSSPPTRHISTCGRYGSHACARDTREAPQRPPRARRPRPPAFRARRPHCRTRWRPRRPLARRAATVTLVTAGRERSRRARAARRRHAIAAVRRLHHLRQRAERGWVSRGRRGREVWVAWRRLRRATATATAVNVCVRARAVALHAHHAGGPVAAGGEVGGGAAGIAGEAREVGRHADAGGGRLEPRGGTCGPSRWL